MDMKDKTESVWINVSDKYINKFLDRKDGHGTFHQIVIPRGTKIGDKDISSYSFTSGNIIEHSDKKYSSFRFDANKLVTIYKGVKLEDGTYDRLFKTVRIEDLRDAMEASYSAYKESKKSLEEIKSEVKDAKTEVTGKKANKEREMT